MSLENIKIAIGSDHGGYALKEQVKEYLLTKYQVVDMGCDSLDSVDYPLYAHKVAHKVASKECDYGILICTTGVGMSMAANKTEGVRAVLATKLDMCKMSREHNNANVLCLGAKYTSIDDAKEYVETFLHTMFAGGRHERRVNLIEEDK